MGAALVSLGESYPGQLHPLSIGLGYPDGWRRTAERKRRAVGSACLAQGFTSAGMLCILCNQ
jgi:hypothetical protein